MDARLQQQWFYSSIWSGPPSRAKFWEGENGKSPRKKPPPSHEPHMLYLFPLPYCLKRVPKFSKKKLAIQFIAKVFFFISSHLFQRSKLHHVLVTRNNQMAWAVLYIPYSYQSYFVLFRTKLSWVSSLQGKPIKNSCCGRSLRTQLRVDQSGNARAAYVLSM